MVRTVAIIGILGCFLACSLPSGSQVARPTPQTETPAGKIDTALRQELLRRYKEDQDARMKVLTWMQKQRQTDTAKVKKMDVPEVKQVLEIDRNNTARMKEIVARYGWPGKSLAGKDGANAAWLLVQHADQDHVFQKRCLQLMEEADKKGEVEKTDLAYLTDRVLVGEHKKQRYGTQIEEKNGQWVPLAIEDDANVDRRRAEAGLQPLADYLKMSREMFEGKTRQKP